jgi:acetylornithine deacetylase/succinyl-diaminopimelate desuccinylase-like protein
MLASGNDSEAKSPPMSDAAIPWPDVHAEALDIFTRYLRIDTSNPPGNEALAAHFLGDLLAAEGFDCTYLTPQPNRDILLATLPGDGSKRPMMLCNHTDVVPVEAEYWTKPAFDGLVEDGRIYGRGAVDMKSAGVMQLITMLLLKRRGLPLRRDLVFCAVPDEEAGSYWGMQWLSENHPKLVDVEFELSEGGAGTSNFLGQETELFGVATNEKTICWLELTAVGKPGHGSRPHRDNSLVHLTRALVKLADWERPITFTPDTTRRLQLLREAGLFPDSDDPAEVERVIKSDPALHAGFHNTLNVTMVQSGIKANVIPAKSSAVIDCRLLPGQDREAWRREVAAVIDDPRVEVTYYTDWGQEVPAPVPWDTELFHTIEAVMKEASEDAIVVPETCIGGTDNRILRAKGIPAYGFIPCLLSREEASGFHGNDEFLTVDNLNMGVELMYEIVRRMCT